jgi:hypothetical protein
VSVAGAYIGRYSALSLQGVLPTSEYMVVIAVVSVVIVSVLLKVDLEVIVSKLRKAIGRE